MLNPRFRLHGLFAVLLALMVQLGAGAAVPRIDPVRIGGTLCHSDDDSGGTPSQAPPHCLVCPLCGIAHARLLAVLPLSPAVVPPRDGIIFKAELPPPATAPPASRRSPNQPRAPPTYS